MHVYIKYHLFPFHQEIIKNISFKNTSNLLAFSGGTENDSLKLVDVTINSDYRNPSVLEKIEFSHLEQSRDIKKSINILRFSPNDKYLATACDTLIIYSVQNGVLQEYKNFRDHTLEITALTWSPDSSKIASSSLGNKIVIRNVQNEDAQIEKVLNLDIKVLSVIWDPFDKYLVCLGGDNNLVVWRTKNWERLNTISLSFMPGKVNHTLKREDRKIDWSPDYKFILTPSLDDKIVPVVCAIDRQDFSVKFTFMGPFSSINCIKFSPRLFEKGGNIISIFAMGDNDGNISIWGLSDKFFMDKPFFLFKSHSNGTELIEDLCWNSNGNLLVATTMKKYISFILFDDDVFGRCLNDVEEKEFKQNLYGDINFQNNTKKLKVFKNLKPKYGIEKQLNNINFMDLNGNDGKSNIVETQFKEGEKQSENHQGVIFTEQQVIIKDGKKKIIPQMKKIVNMTETIQIESSEKNIDKNLNVEQPVNFLEAKKDTDNKEEKQERLSTIIIDAEDNEKKTVPTENNNNSKKKNVQIKRKKEGENKDKALSDNNNVGDCTKKPKENSVCSSEQAKLLEIPEAKELKKSSKKQDASPNPSKKRSGPFTIDPTKVKSINNENSSEELKFEIPKLKPLPDGYILKISNNKLIELEKKNLSNNINTYLKCINVRLDKKEVLWTDILEGEILLYEISFKFFCFYTSKFLFYVIGENGRRYEIPFLIYNLQFLKMNEKNDLLLVKSNGDLRVYNFERKEFFIEENISHIFKEFSKKEEGFPIESVFLDERRIPFLYLKNKNILFYNTDFKLWQKISNDEGYEINLSQNNSKIEFMLHNLIKKPNKKVDEFFEKLIDDKFNPDSFLKENENLTVSKLEEKIIFFIRIKHFQHFLFISKKYIEKLGEIKEINKLRQFFVDLFVNNNSREFIFLNENKEQKELSYKSFISILNKFNFGEEIILEIEHFL